MKPNTKKLVNKAKSLLSTIFILPLTFFKMTQFLYEKSVSYRGYLIIPSTYRQIDSETILSYYLLSEKGHKDRWHTVENPPQRYTSSLETLIEIAQTHLDSETSQTSEIDYFKSRYTYRNNLIIIHQFSDKCFYDHYPPHTLKNIAAPKVFSSESDCIAWVKQGLEKNYPSLK